MVWGHNTDRKKALDSPVPTKSDKWASDIPVSKVILHIEILWLISFVGHYSYVNS